MANLTCPFFRDPEASLPEFRLAGWRQACGYLT